jgi:hypothetical protein
MALVRNVYDHGGIWIGTAATGGDVYDHSGVRIGTATTAGDVYDHGRVRIGRIRATEPFPVAGLGGSGDTPRTRR